MPFKSEAQKAKFGQLVKEGKLSPATMAKWSKETGNKKLPKKVGKTKAKTVKTIK